MKKPVDNKVHIIFGDIGSGKTTYAAAICKYCTDRHIPVYTNTPMRGAYQITVDDLKRYRVHGSMIIIDEAASEVNCRNWRDTGTDLLKILQQIRHYDSTIYWITQSISAIDCQIISLCDDALECIKHYCTTSIYSWKKYVDKRGNAYFQQPQNNLLPHDIIIRKKYYNIFDTNYIPPEDLRKKEITKKLWEEVD